MKGGCHLSGKAVSAPGSATSRDLVTNISAVLGKGLGPLADDTCVPLLCGGKEMVLFQTPKGRLCLYSVPNLRGLAQCSFRPSFHCFSFASGSGRWVLLVELHLT